MSVEDKINISTTTSFIQHQSDEKNDRFVFSYTITITNNSSYPVQLLSRYWVIQDANRKVEEIYGEGVIGEQPMIKPDQSYSYSSGAILETEMGTMEGRYFFVRESNKQKNSGEFEVLIPRFTLSVPRTLH